MRARRLTARAEERPVVALALILAAGLGVRLVLAFTTTGNEFDLESFAIVRDLLLDDPLHVYAGVDEAIPRWPYPPGFFPGILTAHAGVKLTGLQFADLLRCVLSVGDLVLASLVWAHVRRNAPERTALTAAALIALGPSLIFVSGNQGQLDGTAFIPAVAALILWQRPVQGIPRAVLCGVLLGLAGSIKTVPGLFVLALLPTARSPREALTLMAVAAGTLGAVLAPFVLASPDAAAEVLRYDGLPGVGGVSIVVQPELAQTFLAGRQGVVHSGLTSVLQDINGPLVLLCVSAMTVVLVRRRVAPPQAAALLVLTVLVVGVNFAFGYAVWAVVALVLAGRFTAAAALQAILLVPMLIVALVHQQGGAWDRWVIAQVFTPFMIAALALTVYLLVVLARDTAANPAPGAAPS